MGKVTNSGKTTYRRIDCSIRGAGSFRTLAWLAANSPAAKPCAECQPPALPVG